jgi:hypothetical protein
LTHLYEFYWDTLCCGQFTFQIGRLHEKYGKRKPLTIDYILNPPSQVDTSLLGIFPCRLDILTVHLY